MGDLGDSAHGGPLDWVSQYGIIAFVQGNITSSRVWVHGMVIHHSW